MNCICYSMNHSDWHLSFQPPPNYSCILCISTWHRLHVRSLGLEPSTSSHYKATQWSLLWLLHRVGFKGKKKGIRHGGSEFFCVCTSSSLSRCLLAKKKESRAQGWCSGLVAAAPRCRAVTRTTKQRNVCIFCRVVVKITILSSSKSLASFPFSFPLIDSD